ncbi:hypothetical protein KIH39_10205 [Telmatocola sphagniphila]|uniref:Uncharacterized protein n=1 Tax=Telmatocola sphagniphila TaxID=1123043 RepID=A0A8E6EZZ6_9BACT|nr:hypothetical protein [Telmatocola sphagniphila]QVL34253.1 hypothetical protein KIH39_10205 [Telmatocola sphagniphila]
MQTLKRRGYQLTERIARRYSSGGSDIDLKDQLVDVLWELGRPVPDPGLNKPLPLSSRRSAMKTIPAIEVLQDGRYACTAAIPEQGALYVSLMINRNLFKKAFSSDYRELRVHGSFSDEIGKSFNLSWKLPAISKRSEILIRQIDAVAVDEPQITASMKVGWRKDVVLSAFREIMEHSTREEPLGLLEQLTLEAAGKFDAEC